MCEMRRYSLRCCGIVAVVLEGRWVEMGLVLRWKKGRICIARLGVDVHCLRVRSQVFGSLRMGASAMFGCGNSVLWGFCQEFWFVRELFQGRRGMFRLMIGNRKKEGRTRESKSCCGYIGWSSFPWVCASREIVGGLREERMLCPSMDEF